MDPGIGRLQPEAGFLQHFRSLLARCLVTSTGGLYDHFRLKRSLLRASEVSFCGRRIQKPDVSAQQ